MLDIDKKTVCVGMSGGVDSSVAALLLKEQGYNVIGVTMQIWQDEDRDVVSAHAGCCGLSAVDDARRVASQLDIPYYVMNFKEEFKKYVIDYFVDEYKHGRTPNPCIACNRYVKWESLLTRCMAIGGDYIATGHYARKIQLPNGRYTLQEARGIEKDQTYALYNLTQEQLARTLMPVGEYSKPEIRKIAEDHGLMVAHKPDSQDICFVPDGKYADFIRKFSGADVPEGNFIDTEGNVLGTHKGVINYTIGQRKRLGISLGKPAYVVKKDAAANTVTLGGNDDLFTKTLIAEDVNLISVEKLEAPMRITAKTRYTQQEQPAVLSYLGNGEYLVEFDSPQRAVTSGQAAVFYDGDIVVGGGTIK